MTAKKFEELLNELGACSSVVEWAHGKTLHVVWKTCQRGDWLLWLARIMADKRGWPTRKQIVLAACACAETALKYVPKGEERPKKAIQTARAWAKGKATIEEVWAAADGAAAAARGRRTTGRSARGSTRRIARGAGTTAGGTATTRTGTG